MTKREIILLASTLVFISAIAFLRANYLYTPIVDDAFIFFRYAENIVNGHGIVWNIGEKPVEGYTSFLYLVVFIIAKLLSIEPVFFSIAFGVICSTLTLYFAFLIYKLLNPDLITENLFTVFIIAVSPIFLYWSVAGMDTSFYSMFLLFTVYFFLKLPDTNKPILIKGALFGLLCMIRFEAVLFFLFSLLYLAKGKNSFFKIKINKTTMLFALGFTAIFGTYFIWRCIYFGYFLPNTFYAKVGGGTEELLGGLKYTLNSFRTLYGMDWIVIIGSLLFFRPKMLTDKSWFLLSLSLLSIITTIIIGGDHFFPGRFILPILPLLFVVLPSSLNRFFNLKIFQKTKPGYVVFALSIIMIIVLINKPVYQQAISGAENIIVSKKEIVIVRDLWANEEVVEWQHAFILMGNALKKIANENQTIATIPIGAIGYYSKMRVIDMVGIVDPVIAHEEFSYEYTKEWTPGHDKGDGEYVLSRKPDYIQLTGYLTRTPKKKPHESEFKLKSVKEIWNSEEFHRDYEFFPIEVINGWYYNLFKRKC